jgi:hypothetical protein
MCIQIHNNIYEFNKTKTTYAACSFGWLLVAGADLF